MFEKESDLLGVWRLRVSVSEFLGREFQLVREFRHAGQNIINKSFFHIRFAVGRLKLCSSSSFLHHERAKNSFCLQFTNIDTVLI